MFISKRLRAACGSLAAIAAFGAVTASGASASWSDCASSRLCVWNGDGGTGERYTFNDANNRWTGFAINDGDNSSYNHGRAINASVWTGWLDATPGLRASCVPNGSTNYQHAPINQGSSNGWFC